MTGPGRGPGRVGHAGPPVDRLRQLATWLGGPTGNAPPESPESPEPPKTRLVVFGAAPAPELLTVADAHDVPVREVTVDVDTEANADVPAALTAGAEVVDAEVDSGTQLLAVAAPDAPATAAALATIAHLLDRDPVAVVGYGYGVAVPEWTELVRDVRDRMRAAAAAGSGDDLLPAVGSAGLAAVVGFVRQALTRRTPVVLDGPAPAAAAVVTVRVDPQAPARWLPAHASTPGERQAWTTVGLTPLLDLGLTRGDGLAALLTVPILRAAVAVSAGR